MAVLGLAITVRPVLAGPEKAYLKSAQIIFDSAQQQEGVLRLQAYRKVREILDRIVADFPTSDTAVRVMLRDNIDGLDVAALDAALVGIPQTGRGSPLEVEEGAGANLEADGEADAQPATEAAIIREDVAGKPETPENVATNATRSPKLAKPERYEIEIVKDIQTELNRLGCGAGSVDGVVGGNTRAAFSEYIRASGSKLVMEDLATETVVLELEAAAAPICDPSARVSSARLAGSWGWRTDCPGFGNRIVRNRGTMTLRHVGNGRLEGPARNQQGNRGNGVLKISGDRADAYIKYGFAVVRARLQRTSGSRYTLVGTGTRNCKVVAWKK